MAVGDHFRVALLGELAGQLVVAVLHYRQSTGNTSTLTDVESLANASAVKFVGVAGKLVACQSQDVTQKLIEARTFPLPGGILLGFDKAISQPGLVAEAALPPSTAAVIRKKTARLGRAYRGRMFVPGLGISTVVDGVIDDAGTITDLGDLGIAISAALTWTAGGSPTFIPEICTIVGDGSIGDPFAYRANDITSTVVDLVLRSQRRREVGRGA